MACAVAAHALRVGVGIADVTGPPAEIGFVSTYLFITYAIFYGRV